MARGFAKNVNHIVQRSLPSLSLLLRLILVIPWSRYIFSLFLFHFIYIFKTNIWFLLLKEVNLIWKYLFQVRITASWALANICDSIRHCVDDFQSKQSKGGLEVTRVILWVRLFFLWRIIAFNILITVFIIICCYRLRCGLFINWVINWVCFASYNGWRQGNCCWLVCFLPFGWVLWGGRRHSSLKIFSKLRIAPWPIWPTI